jgi:hypothetical protein
MGTILLFPLLKEPKEPADVLYCGPGIFMWGATWDTRGQLGSALNRMSSRKFYALRAAPPLLPVAASLPLQECPIRIFPRRNVTPTETKLGGNAISVENSMPALAGMRFFE